jgi:hypothetical protein
MVLDRFNFFYKTEECGQLHKCVGLLYLLPTQTVKGEDNAPFVSATRCKRAKLDMILDQNASGC